MLALPIVPLLPPSVCLLPTPSLFSDSSPLPTQERLRHIGPEEFVQAFVNKDPLAGTKVNGSWKGGGYSGLHPLMTTRGQVSGASAGEDLMLPRARMEGLWPLHPGLSSSDGHSTESQGAHGTDWTYPTRSPTQPGSRDGREFRCHLESGFNTG